MSNPLQAYVAKNGYANLRDFVNSAGIGTVRFAQKLATEAEDLALLNKVIANEEESRETNTRLHAQRDERNRASRAEHDRAARAKL
jgi:hypothetical protein